jgi:hypothetical protein
VVIAALAVSIPGSPVTLIALAVIGAALALASSLGRWVLLLLAIAAWPFFAAFPLTAPVYFPDGVGYIGQAYLLPAALLVLFVLTARRDSASRS